MELLMKNLIISLCELMIKFIHVRFISQNFYSEPAKVSNLLINIKKYFQVLASHLQYQQQYFHNQLYLLK